MTTVIERRAAAVRPGTARMAVLKASPLAAVLAAGLAVRLGAAVVAPQVVGPGPGLATFGDWAGILTANGPGEFYARSAATAAPGYPWILWLIGQLATFVARLTGLATADVISALLRFPPIVADLAIASLLYGFVGGLRGRRAGVTAAALYLFMPVTWYLSAVWGQPDSVGALFLLGSVILLVRGWSEPAVVLAVAAALVRPYEAVGIAVILPVLIRRHVFARGSGPVPILAGHLRALDHRLDGWLTRRQGPSRLAAAALVGTIAFLLLVRPFDLPALAPADLAGIPVIGHIAGLLAVIRAEAGGLGVLTAQAFNAWTFVGPDPLVRTLAVGGALTPDNLSVLGTLTASAVGTLLLGGTTLLIVAALLVRSDQAIILVAVTTLSFGRFALQTGATPAMLLPVVAMAAVLAAGSRSWRCWYLVTGIAAALNLHAILAVPTMTASGPALAALPPEWITRSAVVVAATAVVLHLAFSGAAAAMTWSVVAPGRRRERPATQPARPTAAAGGRSEGGRLGAATGPAIGGRRMSEPVRRARSGPVPTLELTAMVGSAAALMLAANRVPRRPVAAAPAAPPPPAPIDVPPNLIEPAAAEPGAELVAAELVAGAAMAERSGQPAGPAVRHRPRARAERGEAVSAVDTVGAATDPAPPTDRRAARQATRPRPSRSGIGSPAVRDGAPIQAGLVPAATTASGLPDAVEPTSAAPVALVPPDPVESIREAAVVLGRTRHARRLIATSDVDAGAGRDSVAAADLIAALTAPRPRKPLEPLAGSAPASTPDPTTPAAPAGRRAARTLQVPPVATSPQPAATTPEVAGAATAPAEIVALTEGHGATPPRQAARARARRVA